MSSLQWHADQDEHIVSKFIMFIKLNWYIIGIHHQNLESKSHHGIFNYLVQIVKSNQARNDKSNNRISNQKIKTLKYFAISRSNIFIKRKNITYSILSKNFSTIFLF